MQCFPDAFPLPNQRMPPQPCIDVPGRVELCHQPVNCVLVLQREHSTGREACVKNHNLLACLAAHAGKTEGAAMDTAITLEDVLATPGICQQIYHHLDSRGGSLCSKHAGP
jgi:hypothetical protein